MKELSVNQRASAEGGATKLIYIPSDAEFDRMPFASDANKAEYKKFIKEDKYISRRTGESIP